MTLKMSNVLTAKTLVGNWGTLLLPINEDDSIDFERLSEEMEGMIAARINGIYSNGTAGEFHNQTEDEFDKVNQLLAEKCHRVGMPFQIGASHPSPIISLERLRRSKAFNPSAFQVILPDWVVPTASEQIDFLSKMAEAAGSIPLVLYNPPHAKLVLKPQDFETLSNAIPQLIGIKVADGDAQWYHAMRQYAANLSVFVPGHHLATGFSENVGAGAYSNVACIHPKAAQEWWELMQTDTDEALKLEKRINDFFEKAIVPYKNAGYSNPALDKLLAAVGGWAPIGTRLRWPYRRIPEKQVQEVRNVAKRYLPPSFFAEN
jgi:4-hydroxy-tetrahydrodipicolinate synthase